MSDFIGTIPKVDIEQQLRVMLESKQFRMARNRADFLALVVTRALKGKASTENIIGRAMFGTDFDSTVSGDVRVTAVNLRASLKQYYENEGLRDPVVIGLPDPPSDKKIKLRAGEAYTPVFKLNPTSKAVADAVFGDYYLHQGTLSDIPKAMHHLVQAIKQHPTDIESGVKAAETMLKFARATNRDVVEQALSVADRLISEVVRVSPEYWRAHAARANYDLTIGDVESADRNFKQALALDKTRTQAYLSYQRFLCITGRTDEAVAITAAPLVRNPSLTPLYSGHAFNLIQAKEYIAASKVLDAADLLNKNNTSIQILRIAIYCELGMFTEAHAHLESKQNLMTDEERLWQLDIIRQYEGKFINVS